MCLTTYIVIVLFFIDSRGSEQVSLTVQCFIVSKLYGLWFCFNINILLILIFIVELGNFGKSTFLALGIVLCISTNLFIGKGVRILIFSKLISLICQ